MTDEVAELIYEDEKDDMNALTPEQLKASINRDCKDHIQDLLSEVFKKMDRDDIEYLDQECDFDIYQFYEKYKNHDQYEQKHLNG